jgi:hypothetical protein
VQNIMPTTVAQVLKDSGAAIGQFRTAKGPLTLGDDALTTMRQVAEEAGSTHKGDLSRIVSDIENSMKKNSGAIDATDANSIIRRLNSMSAPGGDPARIADAKKVLAEINKSIESRLNPAEKVAYREAMYRYKIAKALDKAGAVGADGMVNPVSFGRQWDKTIGQTLRGQDTLGQAADTFAAMGMVREHPGSTMQRVFANVPGAVKRNAPQALGVGGVGAAALGLMLGG